MDHDIGRLAPTVRFATMRYRPSIGLQECYEHFEDCFVRYLDLIAGPPYLIWVPAGAIPPEETIDSVVSRYRWQRDGVEVVSRSESAHLLWAPRRIPFQSNYLDDAYFLAGFAKDAPIPDSVQTDPFSCINADEQLVALPGANYEEIFIWCRPSREPEILALQGVRLGRAEQGPAQQ